MIRIGCVSAHPDDASFFSSAATQNWLLRNPQWKVELLSEPLDASSVDVLLLTADDLNKHLPVPEPAARPWILLSSQKADAYKAWQLQAAYFLLRPLSVTTLTPALERAALLHYARAGNAAPPEGAALELQLLKGRRLTVSCKDILFLEARGELTRVYLSGDGREALTATRNLGYWEGLLEGCGFVRTHKKFVVNLAKISEQNTAEIAVGKHRLPIAKRRRKDVEQLILQFQHRQGNPADGPINGVSRPVVKKN